MKQFLTIIMASLIIATIICVALLLMEDNVIEIPFEKYKDAVQVQDNSDAQKLFEDTINSSVLEYEKYGLFQDVLLAKYPKSNESLNARIWMARMTIQTMTSMNLMPHEYRQAWFIKYKEMLEYHENSVKVLYNLALNGYDTYPEESAQYADKAIALDPENSNAYLVSSKAYQMMGDRSTALDRLNTCRDILVNRLLAELKKPYPYKELIDNYDPHMLDVDPITQSDIDFAATYLSDMGYRISVNKSQSNSLNNITSDAEAPDIDDPQDLVPCAIEDIVTLQRVNYFIKRIHKGDPVWHPDRKLSISSHIKGVLTIDK